MMHLYSYFGAEKVVMQYARVCMMIIEFYVYIIIVSNSLNFKFVFNKSLMRLFEKKKRIVSLSEQTFHHEKFVC